MKTAGIVGGLGPESTVDYYRSMIAVYQQRVADGSYPHMLIDSVDVDHARRLIETDELLGLATYLAAAIRRLAAAGADFALVSANTPHIVFDDVRLQSPLPLISIVEAARDEVQRRGLTRVSLLGTRFTMSGRFYPEVFERRGIVLVPPSEEEQAYIHDKYLNELVKGVFLPETRAALERIIAAQTGRDKVEAVILGGTELPLILRKPEVAGVPLLDTTQIHVNAAITEMLSPDTP